jgi:hypothetical protein
VIERGRGDFLISRENVFAAVVVLPALWFVSRVRQQLRALQVISLLLGVLFVLATGCGNGASGSPSIIGLWEHENSRLYLVPDCTFSLEVKDAKGDRVYTEVGNYSVQGSVVEFTVKTRYTIGPEGRANASDLGEVRQGRLIARNRLEYEGKTWAWTPP